MADNTLARQTKISVAFDGIDVSSTVNKYLMSLSYLDNEEDDADDLQIKLEDKGGVWLQKWLKDHIERGAETIRNETRTEQSYITINDSHAGLRASVAKGTCNYDGAVCQIYLEALGFLTDIKVKCDDTITSAIKAFQKKYNLGASGKCKADTWRKLTDAVNGMTIAAYNCTFTAKSTITVTATCSSHGDKVTTIEKGKTCIVTDHPAKGWLSVKYGSKTGYVKESKLTLTSVKLATRQIPTGRIKGLGIRASISTIDRNGRLLTTDCGLFEVDDIKASGPASTVTIKGLSLGYNGIRKTENDESWENTSLKKIATKIASKYELGTLFDFEYDQYYDRVEQSKQTDIALLKKLCQECGYSLKIANNQIVIYDQRKYEDLQEVASFTFGDGTYTKWSLSTGEGQVEYDLCEVSYTNPSTGKVIKGTAYTDEYKEKLEKEAEAKKSSKKKTSTATEDEVEKLIVTNQKVNSITEATELAEKLLKLANKFEREATITTKGNPLLCAGMTVRLYKFGYWSGKYLISKAKHDVSPSSGYTTTITLRKVDEAKYPTKVVSVGKTYKVGDTVDFKGGYQYKSSTKTKPSGGERKAGPALITKIAKLTDAHPYKLQGGKYNKLSGSSNVSRWVDKNQFT